MDEAAEQGQIERVAALEARLDALTGLVERQAEELREIRRPDAATNDACDQSDQQNARESSGADTTSGIGRRRLLLGGATAAVATAAAVVAGTEPAAAANGDPLVLGAENTATATTFLTTSGGATTVVVRSAGPETMYVEGRPPEQSTTFGVKAIGPRAGSAISGYSEGGYGVTGTAVNDGKAGVRGQVTGWNTGNGVEGDATRGNGVVGRSQMGAGVTGASGTGVGVEAISESIAIHAAASWIGLTALSSTGPAIIGDSPHSNLNLRARGDRLAPTTDTVEHEAGDVVNDQDGNLWICVAAGTPGTWRKAGGPATAGAFHVLPTPERVYDSRPGNAPTSVGPKTPWTANTVRTFDLKANGSGVPAGSTAALVTLLLVNAANVNGNLTIWAAGAPRPTANSMVWGGSAGRFTALAVTALDTQARVQVHSSAKTDLVLDVVGYYR